MRYFTLLVPAFLLFGVSACTSLKQVNNYAVSSYTGISKFDDIDYSFRQHDTEDSLFIFTSNYRIARESEYTYPDAQKADSVTNLIYTVIKNYFDGLAKLSDANLSNYNFDTLNTALTEGKFGHITINANQASAYSAIANSILSLATDAHRGKLLKKYVTEGKQPIDVLINAFIFILQRNLEPELRGKKDDLYSYYKTLGKIDPYDEKNFYELLYGQKNAYNNKIDTAYRKQLVILNKKLNSVYKFELQKAANDYYGQIADLTLKQKQIEVYIQSLKEIQAGYQKLYDSIDHISESGAKETISRSAGKIRAMISAFNSLKN